MHYLRSSERSPLPSHGRIRRRLYAGPLQVDYVARSAVFNFPDLIMAQVQKDGPDRSNV